MAKHHIASSLSLLLMLGSGVAVQAADQSPTPTGEKPGVVQRMQRAVVRGSEAATDLLHRATKSGEPDLKDAAKAADRDAKAAAESASQRAAKANANAPRPAATKAKAPSRAASQSRK